MVNIISNVLLFKIGWLACVLGAAYDRPLLGTGLALVIVGVQLASARYPRRELQLIAVVGTIGLVWESVLVTTGWLDYASGNSVPGLAPYWIVAMWLLFASTLNVAMRWMKGRWIVAIAMGGLFGPLAFRAGEKLGAVTFPDEFTAMLALALGWGLLMPVAMGLSLRLDGHAPQPASAGPR